MAKSTNKTINKEDMIKAWTESPFSEEIKKQASQVLAQFKKANLVQKWKHLRFRLNLEQVESAE